MNINLPGLVMEPSASSGSTAVICRCDGGQGEENELIPSFLTALMGELQPPDSLDNGIAEQGSNQGDCLEENKEPAGPSDPGDESVFSPCSITVINDPGFMTGLLHEGMVSTGSEAATLDAMVPTSSRDAPAISFPDGDLNFIPAGPSGLPFRDAPESTWSEMGKEENDPINMAIRENMAATSGDESPINPLPCLPDLPAPVIEKAEGPDRAEWEGRQSARPDPCPGTVTDISEPIRSEKMQTNLWADFDLDTDPPISALETRSGSGDPDPGSAGFPPQRADAIKVNPQYREGETAGDRPIFENVFSHSTGEVVLDPTAENVAGSGRTADNLINQIQSRLVYTAESGNVPGEIRVKLDPPRLGELLIRVVSWQGKLTAEIVAEMASTKEILSSGLDELRQRLEQVNLQLEQIDLFTADELCSGSGHFSRENYHQGKPSGARFQGVSREETLSMPCYRRDIHQGAVNYWV